MINQLIDGITVALNKTFGEQYEIYTEDIEQGFVEPCFFITCVSPRNTLFRDRRFYSENLLLIQYFPEGPEHRKECMGMQEQLYSALESIPVDGRPIFGTAMEGEYLDGVLHFQVSYNTFVDKAEGGDSMETITQQIEVKG